jgi:single-strand DNA-binding protein
MTETPCGSRRCSRGTVPTGSLALQGQDRLASLGPSVRSPPVFSRNNNPLHKEESPMSTSAPNVNSITLVGHLTRDPELRSLPDGRAVCDMRLAVNDRDEQPLFIDVATFGASADACAKYLTKGRQIAVTGRLGYREWQAEDGSKRSKHEVTGRVAFGSAAGQAVGAEQPSDA